MNSKKLLKIGATVAISLCLLFVAAFIGLIFLLPSASQIKSSFTASKSSTPFEEVKSDVEVAADQNGEAAPANSASVSETPAKSENSLKELEDLMDERKPLSEACRTLRNMGVKQAGAVSAPDLGKRLQDSMLDKSSDPLVESLKPVLKLTLQQPHMKVLIQQVMDAPPGEQNSLMDKKDFYYSAFQAYQEMTANKTNMESVLDRSYLTMMFGRLLEVRPELANDPQVLSYCEAIEKQLNEGQSPNFGEEKKAFADFLQEVKVDPKQIGFDSNYQTKLQVDFGKNGLHFKGGWLDEAFAKAANRPNEAGKNE